MRHLTHSLLALSLGGCWDLDRSTIEVDRYPWQPDAGVPEGWSVERIRSGLYCPGGEEAPIFVLSPDEVDPRLRDDAPRVPLAVIFTSGAFDYLLEPPEGDPLSSRSWQMSNGGASRLDVRWAADRSYETLGLLPGTDPIESHEGSLPGALAARGVASLLVSNCWGDLWHNRAGVADNLFRFDGFLRDGRTMAEFAWRLVHGPFPPTNPVELPIAPDTSRIFMIGLGSGSRAIAELLRLSEDTPVYRPRAIVLDSPEDDLRGYFGGSNDTRIVGVRTGLDRIFPGGEQELDAGAIATVPTASLPRRIGVVRSSADTTVLADSHDALDARLDTLRDAAGFDVWTWTSSTPAHVLSNADVGLAKAVADFLGEGGEAVDERYLDEG